MDNLDTQQVINIIDNTDGKIIERKSLQSILIEYIFKNHDMLPEDIIKIKDDGNRELLSINPKYSIKTGIFD